MLQVGPGYMTSAQSDRNVHHPQQILINEDKSGSNIYLFDAKDKRLSRQGKREKWLSNSQRTRSLPADMNRTRLDKTCSAADSQSTSKTAFATCRPRSKTISNSGHAPIATNIIGKHFTIKESRQNDHIRCEQTVNRTKPPQRNSGQKIIPNRSKKTKQSSTPEIILTDEQQNAQREGAKTPSECQSTFKRKMVTLKDRIACKLRNAESQSGKPIGKTSDAQDKNSFDMMRPSTISQLESKQKIPTSKPNVINSSNKLVPGADRVRKWNESFENLLGDNYGRQMFLTFLKTEYSDEVLEFYMEQQEYKLLPDKERSIRAMQLYANYIKIGSEKQINLQSTIREYISSNLSKADVDLFDKAELIVYNLMKNDCYQRFLQSEICLNLTPERVIHRLSTRLATLDTNK